MKKQELEQIIDDLKAIKNLTDKEEYLVSKEANQHFIKILPILNKELERMDTSKVEVNCPAIMIIKMEQSFQGKSKFTLTDCINSRLEELVLNDYKIIDFGLQPGNPEIAYIKYTN